MRRGTQRNPLDKAFHRSAYESACHLVSCSEALDSPWMRKFGSLSKRGGEFKSWKMRLFVLLDEPGSRRLVYFEHESDKKAKGLIDLEFVKSVSMLDRAVTGYDHSFSVVTPHREWFLYASSSTLREEWVNAIVQVIERSSPATSPRDVGISPPMYLGSVSSSSSASFDASSPLSRHNSRLIIRQENDEAEAERIRQEERARLRKDRRVERKKNSKKRSDLQLRLKEEKRAIWATEKEHRRQEYIESCLRRMLQPVEMRKYAFGSSNAKPQTKFFALSDDFQSIKWGARANKLTSSMKISDISWLVFGPFSTVFHRAAHVIGDPARCFSARTVERSLDLEVSDDEVFQTWYMGLQHLCHDAIRKHNRIQLSLGRLFWKRFRMRLTQNKKSISRLVKKAVSQIADLSTPNIAEIRLCWEAFDADNNGQIEKNEFVAFFHLLGEDPVRDEYFEELWDEIDLDGDGKLNFEEFMEVADAMFDIAELALVAKVHNMFLRYDKDHTNRIDRNEVRLIYRDFEGEEMPEDFCDAFFSGLDADGDGEISWTEFLTGAIANYSAFADYHSHPKNERELYVLYNTIDTDGDGELSLEEIFDFLQCIGIHAERDEIERMFTRLDTDDNGQLNFLEFLRLARNLFNVYELGEICRLRNIFKKYDHSSLDEVSSSSTADILSEFLGGDFSEDIVSQFRSVAQISKGVILWIDFLGAAIRTLPCFLIAGDRGIADPTLF